MGVFLASAVIGVPPRVAEAERVKRPVLRQIARKADLPSPIPRLYFRVIKEESILEIWGAKSPRHKMVLAAIYPIAKQSGVLGPKRKSGDYQVPEGFYYIDRFNPNSRFLLSLGISYPNASDRILGAKGELGGDIFIHGSRVSIGCMAMTNNLIQEIYLLAQDAKDAGQTRIPVHIFPFRMTEERLQAEARSPHIALWRSMAPAWSQFNTTKRPPQASVDPEGGLYVVRPTRAPS